jgi:rSAM/selenodomain-associated transferase 1
MRCVVVYGREPIPGRVKTRLAASVGGTVAARIYGLLLEHAVQVALGTRAQVVLALAEPPSGGWSCGGGVPVEVQVGADLGQRMANTFARRFAGGCSEVVVVGSDCPAMTVRHLDDALARLATIPAVLGPATDCGYWLVGQRQPGADLFSGIPWSVPDTLDATRRRLRQLGATWEELEPLRDIDNRDDLECELASDSLPACLKIELERAVQSTGAAR